MAELVDSSERKRNDSKSDYAPVYLRFSLFPIIYCVWEMLGKEGPIVQNISSRGLQLYHLRLLSLGLEGFLVFEALL